MHLKTDTYQTTTKTMANTLSYALENWYIPNNNKNVQQQWPILSYAFENRYQDNNKNNNNNNGQYISFALENCYNSLLHAVCACMLFTIMYRVLKPWFSHALIFIAHRVLFICSESCCNLVPGNSPIIVSGCFLVLPLGSAGGALLQVHHQWSRTKMIRETSGNTRFT